MTHTCAPRATARGDYDPALLALEDSAEDRHFWFAGRAKVIGAMARQLAASLQPGFRSIELGCGNGGLLRVLRESCPGGYVCGMELSAEGASRARCRAGCDVIRGDILQSPLGVSFDLVGLFDVLEHLPDDGLVLRAIFGLLAPGGALVLTVPAHPSLWSYADVAASHYRRYTAAGLAQRLREAGFHVEYLSPFMMPLLPLMWIVRKLAALPRRLRQAKPDELRLAEKELRIVPGINGLLTWMISLESGLVARRRRLPLGTSLVAVARKRAWPKK